MIPWLPAAPHFPPVNTALDEPNGLLAAGGDLGPDRLLAAYRQGIFPWYSPGDPILWWSPDPRMVLPPRALRITRSLAKTLRNAEYTVRLDHDFAQTVHHCASTPRDGQRGTWIVAEMQAAYGELHRRGHAHSVEVWRDGHMIGGLYGVAVGAAFFGESMFSHAANASKIALAHLCALLDRRGFGIIDCQMETPHLHSLGARPLPRRDFVAALGELTARANPPGLWPVNAINGHFRTPAP